MKRLFIVSVLLVAFLIINMIIKEDYGNSYRNFLIVTESLLAFLAFVQVEEESTTK
jgi:hypothetical protein